MQPRKEDVDGRTVSILLDLVRSYIGFIGRAHEIQNNYKSKAGISHYGFVPTDTMLILDTLLRLYYHMGNKWNRYKFLDIGCGIGNVVRVAQIIGFDGYGLEYNKKIRDVAKDFIGERHTFRGDMTTFKNYHKYDVLYYYQPIANSEAMDKFARGLMKAVKCGAYIVANGGTWGLYNSKEFESIKLRPICSRCSSHFPVYKKKEIKQ